MVDRNTLDDAPRQGTSCGPHAKETAGALLTVLTRILGAEEEGKPFSNQVVRPMGFPTPEWYAPGAFPASKNVLVSGT
jgi:hypothetical protein